MATMVTVDGEFIDVVPSNGKFFEVEELQEMVGGDFQAIQISKNEYVLVNEEGLIEDLPINKPICHYISQNYKVRTFYVLGTGVIVNNKEFR